MKKLLPGMGLGALVLLGCQALALILLGPSLMLPERPSPLALDQTVQRISSAATAAGWIVQGVSPIDESVAKHGGPRDRPVRLIKLCQADHAGRILGEGGWGGRADGGQADCC